MADWTVCPHCQLKHTRRPTGVCPRCGAAVDEDPSAAQLAPAVTPSASSGPMPDVYDDRAPSAKMFSAEDTADGSVSAGARVAGGILLVNAALLLLEKVVMPEDKGFAGAPVSMIFDVLIGGTLIAGMSKWLPFAKFRAIAGGIVLTAVHLSMGSPLVAGLQLVFSAGLISLLFGRPGTLRIVASVFPIGLVFLASFLGVLSMGGGSNPLARLIVANQIESAPVTVVAGEKFRYHLTPAGSGWYVRKAEVAKKDNPLADRWITRPDRDVLVIVIGEQIGEGLTVEIERFVEVVIGNAKAGATEFEVLANGPLSSSVTSRLLETRGTAKGIKIHGYHGLFVREPYIYQVYAFAAESAFASVRDELEQTVRSFTLD
jgi:hypothetical protein